MKFLSLILTTLFFFLNGCEAVKEEKSTILTSETIIKVPIQKVNEKIFKDVYGKVCLCSDSKSYFASDEECSKCGNKRRMVTREDIDICILVDCGEGKFYNTAGECVSCSDSFSHLATVGECNKCGNLRKMLAINHKSTECVLAEIKKHDTKCEEGQFYVSKVDSCFSCSQPGAIWDATEEECSKCDKTKTPRTIFKDKYRNYCGLVDCGKDNFHGIDGQCNSCLHQGSFPASVEECSKCGDKRKMCEDGCAIFDCGEEKFHNAVGTCTSCSTNFSVRTTPEECSKCGNKRKIVKVDNTDYCVLENCAEGKRRDSYGMCI